MFKSFFPGLRRIVIVLVVFVVLSEVLLDECINFSSSEGFSVEEEEINEEMTLAQLTSVFFLFGF